MLLRFNLKKSMSYRSPLFYNVLKVPFDWVMLLLAGIFVYWLRFNVLANYRPVVFEISFSSYFLILVVLSFVWVGLFALSGLYQLKKRLHFSKEALKVFWVSSIGILIVLLISFFQREMMPSRFIIVALWFFSIVFVCLGRIIIHYLQNKQFQKRKGLEPIVIIGKSKTAKILASEIEKNPGYGYRIIDSLDSVSELRKKWSERGMEISQVIQADPDIETSQLKDLVDFCVERQIVFRYIPSLAGVITPKVELDFLGGFPIVEVKETVLEGWGRIAKGFFDFIVAVILAIILSPVFLIIPVIIKLDSQGPYFICLTRIGERGRPFRLWKFRSMIKNAHLMKAQLAKFNERSDGPLFKMKNDPRITRFGRILRRTSLDELPQIFNVLRGEMSLVGPRPHEPEEVAQYQIWHRKLLNIKPGITGLAQISGRSDLSFEEEVRLDLYYLQNWSFLFDIEILIKTIPVVLRWTRSV